MRAVSADAKTCVNAVTSEKVSGLNTKRSVSIRVAVGGVCNLGGVKLKSLPPKSFDIIGVCP
ncbi:hypothetical protein GCM10011273_04600 [Asticcacaulis endophyticus]|uniref:Uncharacterized protein n=1 Tax=Asticcacaulis endophyticus TaxID=1395890 RepID=A0A918PV26_9CAUL|nr:hypothetical protein GCM10011273_04600 [Asticcacaulis endophyticus]